MKRKLRKLTGVILAIALLIACTSFSASADSKTMQITLRIEGIEQNFYYETLSIPYTDSLTVQSAVIYADTQSDKLTIIGAEGDNPYITDINGDYAGKFGGWDGWLFTVNDTEASTGMQDAILKDGDSVLLYYGDPYGIGMQYPKADTSKLAKGILRFVSSDTTYDSDWNPIVTENPVADMKVIWDSSEYTTDKNGEIILKTEDLTIGNHSVSIEKTASNGAPIILRFAPDFSIEVTEIENSTTDKETDKIEDKVENPNTSDDVSLFFVVAFMAVATVIITKRRFA